MTPLDILYPSRQRCIFCGREFTPRSWGICPACLEAIDEKDTLQHLRLPLGEGVAAFAYKDAARECLVRLKFSGETWRAPLMARWMAYIMGSERPDAVVAVPIHPLRCIQRTYAQCVLLARHTARYLEIPYEGQALRRVRHSPPLYTLSPEEHADAVAGRYGPGRNIEALRGRHVLLVDDVCTTGSTLTECTRVLLEAGVERVTCVTFAAVPSGVKERGIF